MNSLFLAIAALIMSCSKSSVDPVTPVTPPPTGTEQVAQYGTPFSGVPDADESVIYQVNIRAFSSGGKLQGVTDRLDSIKQLGANVIYLMPVYPVGVVNSVNSPYCVKDYGNVAAEFGNLGDLRNLIDGAHSRGMAVIMDWVANHTSWDNAWITAHPTWYKQNSGGTIISPPNTGWNDVAALNYTNPDMRQAMIKAMKYWVYSANIDGYRCDAADFIPADFWKQAIDSLRAINTHRLIMFAEGTRNDHFTSGFQLTYGMGFYYNLKNVFNGSSVNSIDTVNTTEYQNATSGNQVVRYLSNHDVDLSDGTPADLFGGNNGVIASFIVAAYMKGVPMIYCGQEIGYQVRLNYFNNTTPISWTSNPSLTNAYKQVLAFRKSSEALKTGTLTSYSSSNVCAFTKVSGSEKVVVIANLRNTTNTYTIPAALNNTTWTNAFDATLITLGSTLSLAPYGYYVLKN